MGGAAGGKIAGGEDHEEEEGGDGEESGGVGGLRLEEHGGDEFAESERSNDADEHTGDGEERGLSKDEAKDAVGLGAEGHAQAEFAGALRDGVGGDAVDAETGEKNGERREGGEEERAEALRGGLIAEKVAHGEDVVKGKVFVEVGDDGTDGGEESRDCCWCGG